jgi:hypothetical protein
MQMSPYYGRILALLGLKSPIKVHWKGGYMSFQLNA